MASEPYLGRSSSPHTGTQLGSGEGKAHSHKEQKVCVAGSNLHPSAFCWLLCSLTLVEGELKHGRHGVKTLNRAALRCHFLAFLRFGWWTVSLNSAM